MLLIKLLIVMVMMLVFLKSLLVIAPERKNVGVITSFSESSYIFCPVPCTLRVVV